MGGRNGGGVVLWPLVLLKYETKFNGKILSSKSWPAEDIKDIIFVRV